MTASATLAVVAACALTACSSGGSSGPGTVTTMVTVTRSTSAAPTTTATTSSTATAAYAQSSVRVTGSTRQGPFHIGARVVSAELISHWMANPPGAHGDSLLATVTIDADTATPITLSDAFGDLGTGLRRLSQEAARILPTTTVGSRYERSGITAEEKNFANWTASPEGMQIHFGDHQVGAYADGLISITVGVVEPLRRPRTGDGGRAEQLIG